MSDPDDTRPHGSEATVRDGRRIIVTHQRPHFDEVVAIWLLQTFDPALTNAELQFIPYFGTVPADENILTVGIGGGKFDEHKLDHPTSATRLVFDDLVGRGLIPTAVHQTQAVAWLVDYADKEDQAIGYGKDEDLRPFLIPNLIRSHRDRVSSDADAMRLGFELVDDIMVGLNKRATFMTEWKDRIEFETPWGKGVAVESDYGRSDTYAYSLGFVIRVEKHRTEPIASLKCAPESTADLTMAYEKALALEPTSWYLHQSKKMLISAISPSTGRTPSKLSLPQLIDLVKI